MPALDPIIRLAWESSTVRGAAQPFSDELRQRVLSWEFTDKSSGGDQAKIDLDNSDLSLFDVEALTAGNKLHVQWGYPHDMYPAQVVTIEKIKGFRKLTIEGSAEEARRFIGIQRTRTWEDVTEFDVAEEIARGLGFVDSRTRSIEAGDIDAPRRGITQAGETDMEFLIRLAGHVGAVFYISSGVFHFHERREGRPPLLTFSYWGGEIIGDPEIEHNVQGRPGRVTRRGHSPRSRSAVEGSASNREDTGRPVLGEVLPVSDPDGVNWDELEAGLDEQGFDAPPRTSTLGEDEAQSDVSPSTAESDGEARSQARQRFRHAQRESVKMSVTFIGNVGLRADNTIRLDGLGEKYSGNYYIAECVHSVSAGDYKTKCKLQRNATSRSRGGGRSRRRAQDGATAGVPAGADLPFTSEFGTWDCQGNFNIDEPPGVDVEQVDDVDGDGQERVRYEPRTGLPQSREAELWEEDW